MGAIARLKHAWNVFMDQDDTYQQRSFAGDLGAGYGVRPDRPRLLITNERSIATAIYMRMALDATAVDVRHVRLDDQERYLEDVKTSGLQKCLTLEANIDQTARALRFDAFMTMFEQGYCAIVPVETSLSPLATGGFDILDLRVGTIVQWYPRHVRVDLYNDRTGRHEEVTLPKEVVAIVTNPFYTVMNEPNSMLQRLIRTLHNLDSVGEQSSSGKLDMIIQLPYVVKSESMRERAEQRRKDIEFQLRGSQYGIAYTDGTEKVIQLNRPAENNLLKQVEYLTATVYGQLGITPEIMNGAAEEAVMLNYTNRTVEPPVSALVDEMKRKFLTKTARTQGQSVELFRDPFKLVPMKDLAEMADKFTRNEIVTSNEFRQFIGMKPSKDPKADELRNSNMPAPLDVETGAPPTPGDEDADDFNPFDDINKALDDAFKELGVEG